MTTPTTPAADAPSDVQLMVALYQQIKEGAARESALIADYQRLMDKHNALHVNAQAVRVERDALRAAIEVCLSFVHADDRSKPSTDPDLCGEIVRVRLSGLCALAEAVTPGIRLAEHQAFVARTLDALSAPAVEGGVMDTKRSGIQQQRLMPSSPASMQCVATGRSDGLNQDYSRGLHLWFASRLDARHTVRRWFGEQRVNMTTPTTPQGLPVRDLTDDEKQFLHYNPNTSDLVEFVQSYAHEALAAQAATIEAICKIIECAGPEAADEIADLLGYPSVEWPSDQAASVEPVGKIINSGGNTGSLPERPLLVWFGGVPPVGTELYAGAPPAPASVQDEALVEKLAKRTCEANADSARFTIALQTLRASLDPDDWMGAVTMHNYIDAVLAGGSPLQQHPAPSPAQAVDAVDELREALRMGVECLRNQKSLHPEDFDELDELAVALLKAALATKEPK